MIGNVQMIPSTNADAGIETETELVAATDANFVLIGSHVTCLSLVFTETGNDINNRLDIFPTSKLEITLELVTHDTVFFSDWIETAAADVCIKNVTH